MNSIALFFNTILLYFAASCSPYTFHNVKKNIYPLDDFKMITYAEYLEKQKQKQIKYELVMAEKTKKYTNTGSNCTCKSEIDLALKNINIKQQELIKEETAIQSKRIKLNREKDELIKEKMNLESEIS